MAINRGALLAQTYQLPAPAQQAPIQESPFQDEIGDPASGLQQIDGVTSEYFQKWAALKGFARDVQENLGIDVRYPDPSIPESDRLHRIYLKSLADLKAQGEKLKTDQQMYMADRQRGAIITQDPSKMAYSDMNVGTDIVDAKLDPIVEQANNKLEQLYFGGAIKEAEEYYGRVKGMLSDRIKNDPKNAGYWQRQLDSLVEPTRAEKQFDPNRGQWNRYQSGRIKASEAYLKKMTNLQKGTADSYKLSDTVFGPNKERVWVSEDTKGERYAGQEVVRYEYTPSLKKTEIVIKGKDGNVSRIDLTDTDPMTHAKGYVSDNQKYAANGEWLDIAADEMGYLDPNTGEIQYGNLLAADADQRFKTMEDTEKQESAKVDKSKVQKIESKLKSMLPSEQGGLLQFRDARYGFNIKGNRQLVVRSKDAGDGKSIKYEITNVKEIWPGQNDVFYARMKNLSFTAIRNLLVNNGAHELFEVEAGTESAPSPSTKPVNRKEVL